MFVILRNFEKFGEGIPYDDLLIRKPVENWVSEQCTKHTGKQLQIVIYPELNEWLRSHLIDFQTKHKLVLNGKDTGLIFPELGVLVKQPRLHKDIENER